MLHFFINIKENLIFLSFVKSLGKILFFYVTQNKIIYIYIHTEIKYLANPSGQRIQSQISCVLEGPHFKRGVLNKIIKIYLNVLKNSLYQQLLFRLNSNIALMLFTKYYTYYNVYLTIDRLRKKSSNSSIMIVKLPSK